MTEYLGKIDPQDMHARALLAGLEDYELDAEDYALVQGEDDQYPLESAVSWPVVAVIGRPNVGKSTLVNRVLGRREAVVLDEPGVTRDRVAYPARWAGRDFWLVDTGGWEVDVEGIDAMVAGQAQVAAELADVIVLVVDARVGVTSTDERVVKMIRKFKKKLVLAANKVDSEHQEADAAALWNLGMGEPFAVSSLHGRGSGELLDAIVDVLPQKSMVGVEKQGAYARVALVGRPNVGKSSLLNQLANSQRVVVDAIAGTTRDPVDELIELDGHRWLLVDTAGIRRKQHKAVGADYYSQLRTQHALLNADLALVLLDATEPLTEQDVRVIGQAVEGGRAIVIVNNKWDQVDVERQTQLRREQENDLVQVAWAKRVNISAQTGWHTNRLASAMLQALDSWQMRISTGQLNAFLGELVAAHPHPLRGGKQPRILFGTQAGIAPPRFVLFTTGFLDPGYRRFVERRLRETYGFEGTPIRIGVRVKEKRVRR